MKAEDELMAFIYAAKNVDEKMAVGLFNTVRNSFLAGIAYEAKKHEESRGATDGTI